MSCCDLVILYFAGQLLSNEKFESKMISLYKNGKTLLREFRIQAIKHYQACVEMIKKQYKAHDQLDELLATDSTKDELLKKFEFLISPVSFLQTHTCLEFFLLFITF